MSCRFGDPEWLRNACLGVEQDNKLPFDNIDPPVCRESATRTEQGSGLLTIPVHVAGGQFGQAKFAVSGVSISPGQATDTRGTKSRDLNI